MIYLALFIRFPAMAAIAAAAAAMLISIAMFNGIVVEVVCAGGCGLVGGEGLEMWWW
jgi:hypothetical protein